MLQEYNTNASLILSNKYALFQNTTLNYYVQYNIQSFHSSVFEECRFVGCGAVQILCEPTFRRNVSPAATCSRWFLTRGFFYHEDGGDTFLRNISSHKYYTKPLPTKRHSSIMYKFIINIEIKLNVKCVAKSLQLTVQCSAQKGTGVRSVCVVTASEPGGGISLT
jgi:hypothetical protein